VKLHLGCGQKYLEGYVNIDFPLTEHSVQTSSVADVHADLRALRYPAASLDEIRLHHVFEHFPRQIACALLGSWHSWLRPGGLLRIEVPDLLRTGLIALNPLSSRNRRQVAVRHLFGSHEAEWAAHREAYTRGQLGDLLELHGFSAPRLRRNHWRGTHNIDLAAEKRTTLTRSDCENAARTYLERFLLDESERPLLGLWLSQYAGQLERGWASDV
jgi:hypothetical protein